MQQQNPETFQDMMTMVIKVLKKKNKIMMVTDCTNLDRTERERIR
jgi:hypothetical protein